MSNSMINNINGESEICVSIFCMTYNQENYIRETMEGFLMQKTSFKYEILVHEDASSDNTPEILKAYEDKYPDKVRVIYEEKNIYGTGVDYYYDILAPIARGKYIAICEGDDAWIDDSKLQRQVDYMEQHPECSLVGHKAFLQYPLNWSGERDPRAMGYPTEGVVPYEHIFENWDIPTNSFLFRKDDYIKMPKFFREAPTGDEPLEFYLGGLGEIYFMDRVMSVYNKMTDNSWSERFLKSDFSVMAKYYGGYVHLFTNIDKYSGFKKHDFFNECIKERIRRASIYICSNSTSFDEVGIKLSQIAVECPNEWKDYINEQQSIRFSFWNRESVFWDSVKGKNIYLYGAGRLATKFINEIAPKDMKIKGIIVSDGKRHEKSLKGFDIIELCEYCKMHKNNDSAIVICLKDDFAREAIEELNNNDIDDYIWVYENVYKIM